MSLIARLTKNLVDLLSDLCIVFDRHSPKKLKMINARIRMRRYASPMRGVRHPQLFRYIKEQGAADRRMRRLADFVIACVFLTITLPLMIVVALTIKLKSPGPVLDRQTCIGCAGRGFSDAEISDRCARSGTRTAGMGAEDHTGW